MKLTPEVRKVLMGARELIKDPKHWTRGCFARDSHNRECGWHGPEAYMFCAYGAIKRAAHDIDPTNHIAMTFLAEQYCIRLVPRGELAHFNDRVRHADVLELFDKVLGS
jgi:hypothetical protein